MARNGTRTARGQRFRPLGGLSFETRGTGPAPPAWILLPLHPDRLFIVETEVSCHCDPEVASVYGAKAKTPSASGVAGATRTPTPTKTMPSAITGPLPIGPPTWKVKSGDPVLASRALKKPYMGSCPPRIWAPEKNVGIGKRAARGGGGHVNTK